MGSRNAFIDIEKGNFTFIEDGQTFETIGWIDDCELITITSGKSIKAPEFSHNNTYYAVIQDNKLKHLATYNDDHRQIRCVDFGHRHDGNQPHIHLYLDHSTASSVNSLVDKEKDIINKIIKKGIKIKW